MTAHAEQLRIHVLYELAKTEIKKKRRRILYCNITNDVIQVVKRSKYINIGFSFLVSISGIEFFGIEVSQADSFSVAELVNDIHVGTVSSDSLRILVIIHLKELRLGAEAVILAKLGNIVGALYTLLIEVFLLYGK